MPWKRYEFKGQEVFVRILPTGKPIVHRGRVEIRYKLGATKSYRASPDNLEDIDGEIVGDEQMGGSRGASGAKTAPERPKAPADAETIVIYTDGACSGNPGPAGVGVYMELPDETVEISEYIGLGTNNVAELAAISRALSAISEADRERRIHLYTDSGWSLGVLILGWNAKTNLERIAGIQEQMKQFPNLELLKVRGHAGNPGNEEADRLATMAVRREDSRERRYKRRRPAT